MTRDQLFQLKDKAAFVSVRVDIEAVNMDQAMPAAWRAEEYLRQIGNPYAFKCGEISVNVCFAESGRTFREALVSCFAASLGKKANIDSL